MSGVAARLAAIEQRIASAWARTGRRAPAPVLVGASKSQETGRLREAFDAGLRRFGENRVQEAEAKAAALPAAIEWHLFGPLQSNKARKAADLFTVVHTVDRLKIARALEHELERASRRVTAFLEINLGGEESKHGFAVAGLVEAVRPLADLERLRVAGLMAIPPLEDDPERARAWFRRLRELRDELFARAEWSDREGLLSMGMSGDFEMAIEEGATHVRVGSALFGPRGE